TTKEVGEGTGLGMTNTQNVILNHKGVLEVESTKNYGTTFTIRLPLTSA
ncbi:MAG: HAMP domain-containing histidine kinase, partial [Sphingobacteriaceae bacterium]